MTTFNGKAYSYVRFSSAEQAKGRSKERQQEACEKYCANNNLRLASEPEYTFLDAGRSAWKGDHLIDKGQLARFLRLVEDGTIERGSTLIVESLDRLDRRSVAQALPRFMELLSAGIRVVTLKDQRVYVDDKSEDLIFSIFIFARANDESSQKAERLKDVFDKKRVKASEALKPMGDVAPNWLRLKGDCTGYEPVPEMVKTVERIFELTIAGYGKNLIAKMLNEEERPTLARRKNTEKVIGWGTSAVHHVVMNRAVLGEWQPFTKTEDPTRKKRTEVGAVIKGYFPQVIPEDIFQQAQAAIAGRRTAKAAKQSVKFNVWQGIGKCLHCGSAMHMVNKGKPPKGHTYIECSIGRKGLCESHKLIRLDHSESVFRLMLARLDMRALVMESAAKLAKDLQATEGRLIEQRKKLAVFNTLMDDPEAMSKTLAAKARATEADIADLERERERLTGELAAEDAISFDTFMARLNLDDRDGRSLANTLLKRHCVLVFAAREGFIVTEAGRVKFGLAYKDGKAGYFDISGFYRQNAADPLHVAAQKAMKKAGALYFTPPLDAGPLAYAREEEADQARYDALEDEGDHAPHHS
jgi:DNA invertase Pin-like site-specific DNA recombinase